MKWINHQIVTGFIVGTATDDAICAVASVFGSVLPDRVEGAPPKENKKYWEWRKKHRTWSHYPIIYFSLLLAVQILKNHYPSMAIILNLITYIIVGALLHIAEDGICGKIPIFTPHNKYGLKLFKVGSWSEYFFVWIIILCCLFVKFGYIKLLLNHFKLLLNHLNF